MAISRLWDNFIETFREGESQKEKEIEEKKTKEDVIDIGEWLHCLTVMAT